MRQEGESRKRFLDINWIEEETCNTVADAGAWQCILRPRSSMKIDKNTNVILLGNVDGLDDSCPSIGIDSGVGFKGGSLEKRWAERPIAC